MVEMLGVLAVVSVLSVGGIAAYKNAMLSHDVNGVIQESQKQAMITSGALLDGNDVDSASLGVLQTSRAYQISSVNTQGQAGNINASDGFFGVLANDVPVDVAIRLFERANDTWQSVHKFGVRSGSGVTFVGSKAEFEAAVGEDMSDLVFVYKTDFTGRNCTLANCNVDVSCIDVSCPQGSSCQAGSCVCDNGNDFCNGVCCDDTSPYCGNDSVCGICENGLWDSNTETCVECTDNAHCEAGEFCLLDGTGYSPPYADAKTCVSITDGKKYPYGLIYCPMAPITFNDAQRYCEALGGRLPTINEWKTLYHTVINGSGGRWTQDGSLFYQEYNGFYTHKPTTTNSRGTYYGFCIKDADVGNSCPDGTVLADDGSGHCVDCNSDADCGGDTPYCNTPWHVCVSCLSDDHCGQDSYCTTNTQDTMCNHYSAGCVTRDPSNKGHILNGKQWYWVKNGYATWYEANALCKAYGARMPTLQEFGYTQQLDGTWACDKTKACGISKGCLVSDRFEGQTQCQTSKAHQEKVRTNQLKANGGSSEPSYACCVVD